MHLGDIKKSGHVQLSVKRRTVPRIKKSKRASFAENVNYSSVLSKSAEVLKDSTKWHF